MSDFFYKYAKWDLKPYFYPAKARSAPKLQEIKTFMAKLGLRQVWASGREHANWNSK